MSPEAVARLLERNFLASSGLASSGDSKAFLFGKVFVLPETETYEYCLVFFFLFLLLRLYSCNVKPLGCETHQTWAVVGPHKPSVTDMGCSGLPTCHGLDNYGGAGGGVRASGGHGVRVQG